MIDQYTPHIIVKIAERIDYLRIQNNYSLRELAKRSGISHNSLFSTTTVV